MIRIAEKYENMDFKCFMWLHPCPWKLPPDDDSDSDEYVGFVPRPRPPKVYDEKMFKTMRTSVAMHTVFSFLTVKMQLEIQQVSKDFYLRIVPEFMKTIKVVINYPWGSMVPQDLA